MKKIFTILLVSLLAVVCCFSTGCAKKEKLEVKDIELTSETYAFAINQSNDTLRETIDGYLQEMIDNGDLQSIIDSFFTGDATFKYTNPAEPSSSERANYFVVGTNAYFPPFEMYSGSKLTGVDMKIASVLAQKLGKTLYIKDMDFDALIPSVMNNSIDIAMAGMTVNAERLTQVDFTIGYYTSAQVITVLEKDTRFDDCQTAQDIEDVLRAQASTFKVGTQKGTTGYMYSHGDADFGYDGFSNYETKSYDTGALAMKDLQNGKINAVILDKQPSLMITRSLNK